MTTGQLNGVIQHLRRAALRHEGAGLTDAELLDCFLTPPQSPPSEGGEGGAREAAFEALLRRHGPMVLGVCRRLLQNEADAEDAFQATFLVLVRKAASIQPRGLVGHWLYGVAYKTALKAKAATARRRAREREVGAMPRTEASGEVWPHLLALLDQELHGLPDKYRMPIVLCDLEGKTRKETARQLGWAEGTVASRHVRARVRLAKRLARHGLALSSAALALALSPNAAWACVPTSLAVSTIKAATLVAAGRAAAGVISAQVAALTEGVLRAMLLTKLKIATALVLAVSLVAAGAGLLAHRVLAEPAKEKPKTTENVDQVEGSLKAMDAARNTITITITTKDVQTGQKNAQDKTFAVAADARIVLDQGGKDGGKAVKLADLKEGMRLVIQLSQDKKTAASIRAAAKENTVDGAVKAVDAAKNTITVMNKDKETKQKQEQTFAVAADARIVLAGHGKGGEKVAKLPDLKEGMRVVLQLSQDNKAVVGIRIAAPTANGVIKAVDAAKNRITVTHGAKDNAKDITYEVAKNAPVLIDGKEGKLTDLKEGMPVFLLLSPEDGGVVGIRVGDKGKGQPADGF